MSPNRPARSLWLLALMASCAMALTECQSRPTREAGSGPPSGQRGSVTSAKAEAAALAAVAAGSVNDATPARAPVRALAPAGPPAPPEKLSRAPAAPAYLALNWTPAGHGSPATSYEVRRGDEVVATSRDPFVHFTDLSPAKEYCHTVVAIDAGGARSAPSAPLCVALSDVTPPAAPAGLAARLASPTEVALTWRASTDDVAVVGYEVERDGTVIASTRNLAGGEGRLRAAQRVCYAVRALDAAGNRSEPGEPVCVEPPDVTPPTAPTTVAAAGGPAQVMLRWSGAADDVGVTGYQVVHGTDVVARVTGAAATLTGLPAAVEQCYRVLALDAVGQRSPLSPQACATPPDVTPPLPPTLVDAKGVSESEVVLHWANASDDVGVTGYEIRRDGAVDATVAETTTRVGGFKVSTRHCWTIVARDAAGHRSVPSAEACGTTLDLTPPSIPGNVVAVADGEHAATVHWSPATDNVGVVRYELRREQKLAAGVDAGSTTASAGGLGAGRKHCFTVVAFDQANNGSLPSDPACAVTTDLTPPSPPPAVVAAPSSPTQLVVAWEPSADEVGVTGYEVRRGEVFKARVKRPIVAEPNLKPATEYCYTVRAFDAAGNLSDPSAPRCGTTAAAGTLPGPWNLEARAVTSNEVELTWDPSPVPGVTYAVSWDGRGGGDARVGTTPRSTFRVFGQAAREKHCYQVVAVDQAQQASPATFAACTGGGTRLSSR